MPRSRALPCPIVSPFGVLWGWGGASIASLEWFHPGSSFPMVCKQVEGIDGLR